MSPVVTVQVSRELKEETERYKVEAEKVARRAFEEVVRQKRLEKAGKAA